MSNTSMRFWMKVATAPPMLCAVILLGAAAFGAGTVTVPNTFTSGTVADASQVNANFSALATRINSNVVQQTSLTYGGTVTDSTITATPELLRTVSGGTFTKVEADTDILVCLSTHVRVIGAANTFADFQVRIDGTASTDDLERDVVYVPGGDTEQTASLHPTVLFKGLAAGPHTVEIWVRGNCTSVTDNFGNFTRGATVLELPTQ